jgi:hypothetical protein
LDWTSLPDKNGVYHWKKEQDDQDFIELFSEISKKIANLFWIKLATRGLLLIYNDSTYEILENVSKKEYQTLVNGPDPEIE